MATLCEIRIGGPLDPMTCLSGNREAATLCKRAARRWGVHACEAYLMSRCVGARIALLAALDPLPFGQNKLMGQIENGACYIGEFFNVFFFGRAFLIHLSAKSSLASIELHYGSNQFSI